MNMNVFLKSLAEGKKVVCKYPLHGSRNILKRHEGVVEKIGVGANGPYATIHSADGKYRTLRYDRMVDPVCS